MIIILLDKINNIGKIGEKVKVKAGYARNFLLPKKKAIIATKKNLDYFKKYINYFSNKILKIKKKAQQKSEKLNKIGSITIFSKSGIEGKLFGSIGTKDIALAINKSVGIKVKKNEIYLPNGVLRKIGHHEVNINFHKKIINKLKVIIVSTNKL